MIHTQTVASTQCQLSGRTSPRSPAAFIHHTDRSILEVIRSSPTTHHLPERQIHAFLDHTGCDRSTLTWPIIADTSVNFSAGPDASALLQSDTEKAGDLRFMVFPTIIPTTDCTL